MRMFSDRNYYQILKVPLDADQRLIRRAYQEALELYSESSLATYALFSGDERAELLRSIETAYQTLSDTARRAAYDQMLGDAETTVASQEQRPSQGEAVAATPKEMLTKQDDLGLRVKSKLARDDIRRLADEVVGKDLVSGADLKRLREALCVETDEIFEITRISKSTLQMIEENAFNSLPADVFLKSFLKSYADILQIDAQRVVEGYLKYRTLSERS